MTQRLLLHIGTHKTGTSALQRVFEAERATLARAGIWYPSTNRDPYPQLPKHTSLWAATTDAAAFAREFDLMWREAQAAGCHSMLISEEGFSGPNMERFEVFAPLKRDFDIHVFASLRRQDQYLESLWNQRVKLGREGRPITEFVLAPDVAPRADYVRMLEFWAGIGTVHATEYGAAKRRGIVDQFVADAGLPALREAGQNNPSLGMNDALVRSWLAAAGAPCPPALAEAMKDDGRRQALGSVLRQRILADYRAINAELARRYGIVFDEDLPQEPAEPLTSPDPDFLIIVLLALLPALEQAGDLPAPPPRPVPRPAAVGQLPPNDLRDAALALRESNPDLALRLAQAALAMRPTGPAIERLVEQLQAKSARPAQARPGRSGG